MPLQHRRIMYTTRQKITVLMHIEQRFTVDLNAHMKWPAVFEDTMQHMLKAPQARITASRLSKCLHKSATSLVYTKQHSFTT